jgi:hypothetical protein
MVGIGIGEGRGGVNSLDPKIIKDQVIVHAKRLNIAAQGSTQANPGIRKI